MDEFPNSDEEFELTYGDELEVLREHNDEQQQRTPKKSRRSLDFTTEKSDSPVTNKRTIEELFGDIDDILYDNPRVPKKHKGDKNEADYALIEQILELRKLAKERDVTGVVTRDYTSGNERDLNNISYTVPKYPFIGVTRHDGERVYVRFHSEQFEKEERQRIVQEINSRGVLGDDCKEIWDQAQYLIDQQLSNRNVAIAEARAEASQQPQINDKDLWVDLYKPRKYFELLSDESTNRIILRWLKLWDKVVFNRRPKIKALKSNDKTNFRMQELCTELDDDGRPHHKVALLCGPPGLGKTTLAHMVARHAGYNVVEVNASDDRSIDVFKTRLENSTQMRSVVDVDRRPNCLIFDEIDGAPAASINYLVKFITGAGGKTKKNHKGGSVLRRPIICICNDVYVPSLRPLRQIAFVVNFPSTSNARLAERLMEIANKQRVKTDLGAMLALAEKSQNDIRSCLSILHFFKNQSRAVTLSDVHKASVGQKDTQKGLFAVWQDIFLIDKLGNKQYATAKQRMAKILNVVNSFGDYEKLAQGVFENYPNLNFKSVNLDTTCQALEWFSRSDIINKHIYSTQNYTLSNYLQYAFVVWHYTFATKTWQKLQYPNVGYEVRTRQSRQKAIIAELMRGIRPSIRSYVQPVSLVLDILPLLSTIIVPPFRPINLHLYTEEEKKNLDHVVNVMIDYNLNYVQERTPDGTYVYKLDPNIDEVVSFGSKKSLSYSNKQLVAKEIEMAKMRRCDVTVPDAKAPLPNHLQTLQTVKTVTSVEMPAKSREFFWKSAIKKPSSDRATLEFKNDIWYKYKEGYNNAVRKKIKVSALK